MKKKTNKTKNKNSKPIKVKSKPNVSNSHRVVPLGSRVLVRPFSKEELEAKNNFGIILPQSDKKEKSEQGEILAVGRGEYKDGKLVSLSVNVGDRVVFSKYGYDDVEVDGEELYLIKEENILAVLK